MQWAVRIIGTIRAIYNGIFLGEGKGTLYVSRVPLTEVPADLNTSDPDHIIMTAAIMQKNKNRDKDVRLVSRDINMRVMTDSLGIESEDYVENQIIQVQSDLKNSAVALFLTNSLKTAVWEYL